MSVSPTGWNAIFKPYRIEPVVGWDEYGVAQIVDPARGRRVSVDELTDHSFENLEPAPRPFIGTLPALGWTLEWSDDEANRILGFAVQDDGQAIPILFEDGLGHGSPYYRDTGDPRAYLKPPRSDS